MPPAAKKPAPTKATTSPDPDSQVPAPSEYRTVAAKLAADGRDTVEEIRDMLKQLLEQHAKLADLDPGSDDTAAMDAARRVPMAVDDLKFGLTALDQVAAELAKASVY